jgi:hypothetical protein
MKNTIRTFGIAAFVMLLATTAFAQTEDDFRVTLTSDGTGVVITGYTGKAAAVTIPAAIQGKPVREIGGAVFFDNQTMTSVIIPEGVICIGESAFSDTKLTAITLPTTLTSLGHEAFSSTGISAVTLPGSLTDIGAGVFWDCKSLKTVTLSEGITEISDRFGPYGGMFQGCITLTTVTLPSTLTTIGSNAFSGCSALTVIALPASIKTIGRGAFGDCTALTTVTIPATVQKIVFANGSNDGSFAGCTRLNQAALMRVGYSGSFLPGIKP